MSDIVKFKPIRGLEEDLMNVPHTEGAFLVATDTGKMWLDTPKHRVALGGSGASLLYGNATAREESDENGNYYYIIDRQELDDPDIKPQVNDLILNSDGSFYRITEIEDDDLICNRLAVSGNGSGGGIGGGGRAMTIKGKSLTTTTLVNGQSMKAYFTATSQIADGEPLDDELTISWSLRVTSSGVVYDSGTFKVKSGEEKDFEFGTRLRDSTGSTLSIYATGVNSGKSKTITFEVTTVELLLYESEHFSNIACQSPTSVIYCNVSGAIDKILDFYIDDVLVHSKHLSRTQNGEQSYTMQGVSHGYHTVRIDLFQSIDGERGVGVNNPLVFEIAVDDGVSTDPIIWLGDYKQEYYNYDAIKIPYRVYSRTLQEIPVTYVKGITELGSRIEDKGATQFSIWQITDASMNVLNTYTIRVEKPDVAAEGAILAEGESKFVTRDIKFTVVQDPNRDLSITSPETLMLNFSAAGRSNNEPETSRQSWTYTDNIGSSHKTYNGKFENFNWYNNGWILDENNDTCLRISNGAQFSIPVGEMVLNNSANSGEQSRTFEFEFKIRNVQDYSNLIREYTRYSSDQSYWDAFLAQLNTEGGYDNYDNYLRYVLSLPGQATNYDKISEAFAGITRLVTGDTPFCKYYDANGRGFCLGPQDGFFSSANNTLNVKYVENKLINLSIVFNYTDKRIYFYLQGILTAVCKITDTQAFTIASNDIVFNSQYCDIDLYKLRIYNNALSVRNVLINYAVDHSSVLDYDHTTQLISYNENTKEYQLNYSSVKAWNEDVDHKDDQLMPYVIWDTGSRSTMLPYSKADKKSVGMEFVNTGLDAAYKNGTLEELANQMSEELKARAKSEGLTYVQFYYKHHCPSFVSKERKVNLAVQGTSSQFYPRRNYKAKTKGTDEQGNDCIYMYMNRGPFAELYAAGIQGDAEALEKCHLDFFYYDNYSVGTTKFTMKIDFMESSGTYNMGLANLVHSAYTKHPTDDYNAAGAFNKIGYTVSSDTDAQSGKTYYSDSKGKNKVTFTEENPYVQGEFYEETYTPYTFNNTKDFRTNVQGFPVMGFWRYGESDNDCQFIGRYNMLLDKGSDEVYNFKPSKSITAQFLKNKTVRKKVECWEFSDNQRTYCSFKDPLNRYLLSFNFYTLDNGKEYNSNQTYYYDAQGLKPVTFDDNISWEPNTYYIKALNAKNSCPIVADSFEFRYNDNEDFLDYIYDPTINASCYDDIVQDEAHPDGSYTATQLKNLDFRAEEMFDIYKNWEKACQWVWSTNTDSVPSEAQRAAGAACRLIMKYTPVEENTEFDSTVTYYDYCGEIIANPEADDEGMVPAGYYIGTPAPVTYDTTTYTYDTKEYRAAKFVKELSQHFDLEYLLVYFVITEVLLCYDSRGKNCMMASWGPLSQSGDYIWYPVFYDMDTQLGINNTGIPSFEYSENATIDGTFSTSDSVLWTNLYQNFKENITATYHRLRNEMTSTRYTGPGTLSTVDHIEKWYLADPTETNQIVMRGARPLCMFNMDEWFKFISITNDKIQYQNGTGGMSVDSDGTFFYALQGDRSLSRQQFVARRLNFVDSWLGEGDYSRAGANGNSIRGRFGANNKNLYSDEWVTESSDNMSDFGLSVSPYYVLDSDENIVLDSRGYKKKVNYLDADFYLDLTPYQKSYVTLGTDTEAFPSIEYNGKAVCYELPTTQKNGILSSPNLSESLIYIYGPSALKDMGDVSMLYWSEFYADNSPHLSRLLLGNDHPSFYNKALKTPGFNASTSSDKGGKPLLKEVNLSGVQFVTDAQKDFDFTSCEKMQIFKALRSNITSIQFANGVALHTLYLPNTITSLKLVEAANLTNIIHDLPMTFDEATYTNPDTNTYYSTYNLATNSWTAMQGLYIEGLTNLTTITPGVTSCALASIEIAGGNLGYASYDLLNTLYKVFKEGQGSGTKELKISMTNVKWSPYYKLDEDAIYDSEKSYYVDNGHYGFAPYVYTNTDAWELALLNGEIYGYNEAEAANIDKITDIVMLQDFINRNQFKDTVSTGNSTPVLTGSIYVNNTDPIDESYIRNTLLTNDHFPGAKLDIHFANVTPGYRATFKQVEPDGTYKIIGTQVIDRNAIGEKQFTNPYTTYEAKRDNYDFHGWSTNNTIDSVIPQIDWADSPLTKASGEVMDYTYYAMFTKHKFNISFKVGTPATGFVDACEPMQIEYTRPLQDPGVMPSIDESDLEMTKRYRFLGWTQNRNAVIASSPSNAKTVNLEMMFSTEDFTFYAVFCEESVYDSVTDLKYFRFERVTYTNLFTARSVSGYAITLFRRDNNNPEMGGYDNSSLSGKITLPSYYNGEPVIKIAGSAFNQQENVTQFFFERDNVLGACQVKMFDQYAFNSCPRLRYVELPESLEELQEYSLANCENLDLNTVGNNLQFIHSYALNNSLTNITSSFYIGGKVRYIKQRAFNNIHRYVDMMYIGSPTEPSQLRNCGSYDWNTDFISAGGASDGGIWNNNERQVQGITIYCTADDQEFFRTWVESGQVRKTVDATVNIIVV